MSATRKYDCCPLGVGYRNRVQARKAMDRERQRRLRHGAAEQLCPRAFFRAPCGRWHLTNRASITDAAVAALTEAVNRRRAVPDALTAA